MSHLRSVIPAFFILTAVFPLAAEEIQDLFEMSLTELMDIPVVTASRYEENLKSAAAVMTIVSADQIRNSGADSLYQLLEQVSSFYMTGSHFFPNNVSSVRGDLLTHADNHVLILLNGKPLRESYSGGINFAIYNAFPVQAISRIEVIRGPGSVLYGSNAYSGVINLVTTEAGGKSIQLSMGEQGYQSGSLLLSGGEELKLLFAAKVSRSDGWDFRSFDNAGVENSIDYGQRNLGLFSSLTYKDWQLDLMSLSGTQDFFGASTSWSGTVLPEDRKVDSQRHHAALSHQWQQSEKLWLDSAVSVARMDFSHYNYDAYSTERYLELNQHWQPSKVWSWQLGGSLWWQRFGTEAGLTNGPVPLTKNRRDTAFVQADWSFHSDWKWSAGLQYNNSQLGSNEWVPRMALVWQANQDWAVKLLHANAYRDPYGVETNFNLILRNPAGEVTGGLRGNPDLLAERVNTTDLQLFYQADAERFSLTLFQSKADELISRQRAADRVIDFVNQGEMQLHGVELEWSGQVMDRLTADLAITWQQNEVNEIKDFTTVPHWLMKSAITYQLSDLWGSLHAALQYTGEAEDVLVRNSNRQLLNPTADAYWLMNLSWRLPLPDFYDAQLQTTVYNLWDQQIYQAEFVGQSINTIPARSGRQFGLSLRVPF
ncbi:outer membrane receptor for ferrienterochelin and colicin [Rheinheimera sp. A13L]|nr:outer membrane receptor for ferrienterochelin and colicin [Rheinheimera sp. A13L]